MGRSGCGVPRVALQAAPGRRRKPALRHYERTRGARMCSKARGLRMLRGTGRHKPRVGAPRGERPTLLDARRLACACGPTLLARPRVPQHPSACRRSASLVAVRGSKSKPRRRRGLARRITRVQIDELRSNGIVSSLRSSPRKRGPRATERFWIPACAGMSGGEVRS
jgi:hypothetical protein